MATLPSLRPNGLGPVTAFNSWVATGAATTWEAIDDDPDSPNDADYIENSSNDLADGSEARPRDTATFTFSAVPADFASMDTVSVTLRCSGTGYVDDFASLSCVILDATLTTQYVSFSSHISSSNPPLGNITRSGTLTNPAGQNATKADWDAAVLLISRSRTSNMGADTITYRVSAVEINGTYTAAAGGNNLTETVTESIGVTDVDDVVLISPAAAPTTSLTPGDGYVDVTWTDPIDLGSSTTIVSREYTTDGGVTWRAFEATGPSFTHRITETSG